MEWTPGGRALEEHLAALEAALHDYFGSLNEIAMDHPGLDVKVPEKPEALVLYQQCESLNFHPVEGGLLDQPFILMQEIAVVHIVKELHEMMARNQRPS